MGKTKVTKDVANRIDEMLRQGVQVKVISIELGLHEQTIKAHRTYYEDVNVKPTSELLAWSVEWNKVRFDLLRKCGRMV